MTDALHFTPQHADDLFQVMRLRRDIRGNNFLGTPIAQEDLDKILDAALLAPSVGFSQPWEFVLVRDEATRREISHIFAVENDFAKQAFKNSGMSDEKQATYAQLKLEGIVETPINIAVFYRPSVKPVLGQTSMPDMGKFSVVSAVQNMWLMARALNIGMGWVSILNETKVKAILNAPQDRELIAYLCLGHVKAFEPTPELERLDWEKRKQRDDVIKNESY